MQRFTQADAQRIAAQIDANVKAVDAGSITWSEFGNRNRAAWDEVARGEMNIIGSACDKRHMAVKTALVAISMNEHTQNQVGVPMLVRDWVSK